MGNDPDQLLATTTLTLVLLLAMGVLATRLLRAIPGAGWLTPAPPGRGLLRRTLLLLVVLLVGPGLVLDALAGDGGRERLPVFVVNTRRTPAIAAHLRAAQAAGKPTILHRLVPVPAIGARGPVAAGATRAAATSTRSPPPWRAAPARPASPASPSESRESKPAT